MSAATVAAVLARWDDDAWVALANRGLLRRARKDLETLEVRLLGENDDAVEVGVGDRVVRMGGAGPAEAVCSCPSVVVCQHVVTAGLWLAATAEASVSGGSHSEDTEHAAGAGTSTAGLQADLMGLDAAALT